MGRHHAERMRGAGLSLAVLSALTIGCATDLLVKEFDPAEDAKPSGVVVNKRKSYSGTVALAGPLAGSVTSKKVTIGGVDHDHVISVGICRQPFASGTLDLTLSESQVLSKASVVSTPGLVGAVKATTATLDSVASIKEQKAKEKKEGAEASSESDD